MADTLLDILNRSSPTAPTAGAGSTDTLAKLLAARTGRAAPTAPSAPREENLLETAAVGQTKRALGDVGAEQRVKTQAVETEAADVSQQSAAAQQQLDEKSKQTRQSLILDTQRLLDQAYAQRLDLRASENKARAEQIGFGIRLANEEYVNQLQMIGEQTRADTEIGFREAYREAELGGLFDLFGDRAAQEELLAMDDSAFQLEIGKYAADWELYFERLKGKQASAQAMFSGFSSAITGGLQAAHYAGGTTGAPTGEGTQEQKIAILKAKQNGGTLDP